MTSRYMTGVGMLLLVAITSAAAQQPGLDTEVPQLEEVSPDSAEPREPAQTEPEPAGNSEPAETFVPTEDISEDRSVSFPVDI